LEVGYRMPGISHLIFGLMIVIPLMYFAKEKFNYKVATIFVLNNWIGPDSYWPYRWIPLEMHALLGFLVWAIPLSLFYSYLSRFSFSTSKWFFSVKDDGKRDVSWKNSYIVCVAGATFHNVIDMLFHGPPYGIDLFPSEFGIPNPNLGDLDAWGTISYGYSEVLIVVGYVSMITMSLLIIYFLRKRVKDVLVFLVLAACFVILSQVLLGWETFGERELSATSYSFCFIFLPLMGFAYVLNHVNNHPTKPSEPLISKETAHMLVAIIALILAGGFLFLGLSPFFAPSIPDALIGGYLSAEAIQIVGIIVSAIATIGVIGAIGLFFKNKICRYFVIFVCIPLWFFVFPFAIVLFLSRDDIKEMYFKA